MYKTYPNIILKIRKKIKESGLENIAEEPEKLVKEEKRFYRTFAKTKKGKRVFFKSLLKEEKGIKNRFLNEVSFYKIIAENPQESISKISPKLLDASLEPSFPYLIYEFIPGKTNINGAKFKKIEIKEIAKALIIISLTPKNLFNFRSQVPLSFSAYKRKVGSFLKKTSLGWQEKKQIGKFVEKSRSFIRSKESILSHGDFSEANLIFNSQSGLKIIDWEHINFRNPFYDLADFWKKRFKYKEEQKTLIREYLKNAEIKDKEKAYRLFQIALLEVCLRDIKLFLKMIKQIEKERKEHPERTAAIKKIILVWQKEIKECEDILRSYILKNKVKELFSIL